MVAPYDHYRVPAGEGTLAPGVYRVVGVDDERVTLLAVGDADGRRVHTGRIERVPRGALERFEPVGSPDPSGPATRLRSRLDGVALTARFAPGRMARRPLQTALGVALLVPDLVGLDSVPESVATAAAVLGVLLLTAAALDRP